MPKMAPRKVTNKDSVHPVCSVRRCFGLTFVILLIVVCTVRVLGFLMVANADDDADYSHKQWSGITDKWIQHDTWLKIADFSRNSLAWYMESETSTDHSSGYWFGSYSFVFMLIICVSLLAIYIIKSKVKRHGVSTNRSYQRTRIQHFQSGSGRPKLLYMLFVVLFFVSYVWESINLYQQEVAKKVAAVVKLSRGAPRECDQDSMTWWDSLTSLLRTTFTWSHDHCEEYYKAVLVDPLWSVSPLKVLISLIVRCCSPLENLSSTAGAMFRAFMREIPVAWQPVVFLACFVLVITISVFLILVCAGYTWHVPFVFTLAPRDRMPLSNVAGRCDTLQCGQERRKKTMLKSLTCEKDVNHS